jgi:hypothetical protein
VLKTNTRNEMASVAMARLNLLKSNGLAWWPELTALPTSIFAEMRGLARDETTLPLAMQPKVTALVW